MTRWTLVTLAVAGLLAAAPGVRAQAVAESAVIHGNSAVAAGVARALGGRIQESLSKTDGQFSYPPGTLQSARHTRTRRNKARVRLASRSPIAISSVVGGPASASCPAAPKPVAPQAKPAVSSSNCVAKPPVASAKSNPSEITVSF